MTQILQQYSIPLPNAWMGKNIFHLRSCPSTQDKLKELSLQGYPQGTVVLADRQTQGRGQHGNDWVDFQGEQLFVSFSYETPFLPQNRPILNLLIAICVIEIIFELSQCDQIKIKWPNDLYLHGGKIGGILSETFSSPKHSLIISGLGVNLSGNFKAHDFPASSLESNHLTITRFYFLHLFLERFEKYLTTYSEQKLTNFIQERFSKYNLFSKKIVEFKSQEQVIHGHIQGIDVDGSLLLEKQNSDIVRLSTGKIITTPR